MIQPHSIDPDVALAAEQAHAIIANTLSSLPRAEDFDYGGHRLKLSEYDVCTQCSIPIAEAQQASEALTKRADGIDDPEVKSHIELAAELFRLEAEAAIIRAQLHNGLGSEVIVNELLGFQFARGIHDDYHHTHTGRNA